MIFYRSLNNPAGTSRSLAAIRRLVMIALAAYPAGALLRVLGPADKLTDIGGFALILVSLAAAGALVGSRLNRLTGEEVGQLDEYERNLRGSALETAFQLFAALTLAGVIYLAVASDADWWVPKGYEQRNGVFWGVFLYASLLPTAVLAFRLSPDEDEAA